MYIEENPGVVPMLETMIFNSVARHDVPHGLLDLADDLVRDLQTAAGRGLEIDDELRRIRPGEIRLADQRIQGKAQNEDTGDP